MTPGPTEVPERVREAMSRPIHNPDIDEEFFEFYHTLEDKLKRIYETEKDVLILGGEGILGLEASIASLIDKGDEV
ncbi:MAG: alanine--glyoxylate aminotransferase family protein, partial [Thermoplasmatota archaeon]